MGKIVALELVLLNVRVNLINADVVFGDDEIPSGLWEVVGPGKTSGGEWPPDRPKTGNKL